MSARDSGAPCAGSSGCRASPTLLHPPAPFLTTLPIRNHRGHPARPGAFGPGCRARVEPADPGLDPLGTREPRLEPISKGSSLSHAGKWGQPTPVNRWIRPPTAAGLAQSSASIGSRVTADARLVVGGPVRAQRSPPSWRRSQDHCGRWATGVRARSPHDPSPRSAMVIDVGCSSWNGVSVCAVLTPEAIGYSSLIEQAGMSCPCLEKVKDGTFLGVGSCPTPASTFQGHARQHALDAIVGIERCTASRPEMFSSGLAPRLRCGPRDRTDDRHPARARDARRFADRNARATRRGGADVRLPAATALIRTRNATASHREGVPIAPSPTTAAMRRRTERPRPASATRGVARSPCRWSADTRSHGSDPTDLAGRPAMPIQPRLGTIFP